MAAAAGLELNKYYSWVKFYYISLPSLSSLNGHLWDIIICGLAPAPPPVACRPPAHTFSHHFWPMNILEIPCRILLIIWGYPVLVSIYLWSQSTALCWCLCLHVMQHWPALNNTGHSELPVSSHTGLILNIEHRIARDKNIPEEINKIH